MGFFETIVRIKYIYYINIFFLNNVNINIINDISPKLKIILMNFQGNFSYVNVFFKRIFFYGN